MLVLQLAYDAGHKLGQAYKGPPFFRYSKDLENMFKEMGIKWDLRKCDQALKDHNIQRLNTIKELSLNHTSDPIIPDWKLECEYNAGFMRGLNHPTEHKIYMTI